jgi:hypothetical protein
MERPSALRMMSHMALDGQQDEKDFGGCVNWCLVSTSLCLCLSLGSQQLSSSPAKSSCVCDHLRYSFWSIFARMTWPTVALIGWVRLLQNIAWSKLLEPFKSSYLLIQNMWMCKQLIRVLYIWLSLDLLCWHWMPSRSTHTISAEFVCTVMSQSGRSCRQVKKLWEW